MPGPLCLLDGECCNLILLGTLLLSVVMNNSVYIWSNGWSYCTSCSVSALSLRLFICYWAHSSWCLKDKGGEKSMLHFSYAFIVCSLLLQSVLLVAWTEGGISMTQRDPLYGNVKTILGLGVYYYKFWTIRNYVRNCSTIQLNVASILSHCKIRILSGLKSRLYICIVSIDLHVHCTSN